MPGFLTPGTIPTEFVCRVILIPNSEDWISVVTGALNELIEERNWQPQGAVTPFEAASAFLPRFDDFCFQTYNCEGRVIGEIICYAGGDAPSDNFLACDGGSYLRADYPSLYGKIGTTYGSADSTHFNLPDLRGRSPVGSGHGTGLTDRSLGDQIGAETHTLITSETPAHSHVVNDHAHNTLYPFGTVIPVGVGAPAPAAVPANGITGGATPGTSSVGGDGAHNNMQPSLALAYWIVAQ